MSVLYLAVLVGCSGGDSGASRGEFGADCYDNGTCNDGLSCAASGECVACEPGMAGCGCDDEFGCEDGLFCQAGLCVPTSCEGDRGGQGCACDALSACEEGLFCGPNGQCATCTSDIAGCECEAGAKCGPGLVCNPSNLCERDPALGVRLVDQCYTPCRTDIIGRDGTRRHCSAQGLMRGCLDDLACVEGSCVAPGSGPRLCESEGDCPDFQTCEAGQCFSTCEGENDCGGGTQCYRHVCRTPCSSNESSCGQGEFCDLVDGVNGYCQLLGTLSNRDAGDDRNSSDQQEPYTHATLRADITHFGFTPAVLKRNAQVSNEGSFSEPLVVRRVRHVANRDLADSTDLSNEEIVTARQGDVLPWLKVGLGSIAPSTDQQFTVQLEAGEVAELSLEVDASAAPERWEGELEIVPDNPRTRSPAIRLFLNYKGTPQGRWEGNAYYFSSFGTKGLETWINDRNTTNTDALGNAFIRQWRRFSESQNTSRPIPYQRFQEVLTATVTESWDLPSVRDICPPSAIGDEAICYLSGVSQGYQYYTQSPSTNPVPSGVTELPVVLNLRGDMFTDPTRLSGRVDSQGSLHYPGNPSIDIEFEDDTTSCPNQGQAGSTCVVGMKSMEATAIVAGRYALPSDGSNCRDAAFDRNFERVSFPWLVPGFYQAADYNAENEAYYKEECRGDKYPWGPGERCEDGVCAGVRGGQSAEDRELNQLLSQANPVPDGLQRVRRLELVDGALIDGQLMLVIFKEKLESFMDAGDGNGAVDFETYGFMLLERSAEALRAEDYEGVDLAEAAPVDSGEAVLTYQCSDAFLNLVDSAPTASSRALDDLEDEQVSALAEIMLNGRVEQQDISDLALPQNWSNRDDQSGERAHYLCKYQEVMQGGQADEGSLKVRGFFDFGHSRNESCPTDAKVEFFTLDQVSDSMLAGLACNADKSCHALFEQWKSGARTQQDFGDGAVRIDDVLRTDVYWECNNGGESMRDCSDNRYELREGKTFYKPSPTLLFMKPIEQEIAEAFRFRTQFLSRDNTALGFAPDICAPNPNTTPYCYDPQKIEELRERTDCLLAIYNHRRESLGSFSSNSFAARVRNYLTKSFSSHQSWHLNGDPKAAECSPSVSNPACQSVDNMGFERLYAELIIMLGDEAYTRAFSSRFDLAQSANNTFQGQEFEGKALGINLSGGAGHELHTLYQAVQYHQMLLDRFYSLSKGINQSLVADLGSTQAPRREQSFINQRIVTLYFDRLIKSSTQKSRAWGEISKRYVQLNRPQLARRVIERAYVSTYLESMIFSRLMDNFGDVSPPEDRAIIDQVVQRAQTSYKVALMDMRSAYQEISDDLTHFGFQPDYMPFPVLGQGDANAFERMMSIASDRSRTAGDKEVLALASDRSRKVDMAEFQNELFQVSSNFEGELQQLCGSVTGSDGMVYPAIPKYIDFFKDAGVLGALGGDDELNYLRQIYYQDPCGRFNTGDLFEARLEAQTAALDYQSERQKWKNILTEMELANDRVEEFCAVEFDITQNMEFQQASGEADTLAARILQTEQNIDTADRQLAMTTDLLGSAQTCAGAITTAATATLGAVTAGVAAAATCAITAGVGVAHAVFMDKTEGYKKQISADQAALSDVEGEIDRITREWEHSKDCEIAQIDLNERLGNLVAQTLVQKIEIQKAILRMDLANSTVAGLEARIQRVQSEHREAENMSINIAAARNDPNVRIYKNDSIITADRTFQAALRATYKATRVFEYYSGQSYAALDKLFLIRSVTFGDYSLESYLADLQDAYIEFQETYGVPDLRVMIVSVREDVFQTMLYGPDGAAQGQRMRDEDFSRMITSPSLLDENGYISIPFSTSLAQTSPLTHNHKIVSMQAELVYAGRTDALARLYVRQNGTGQVRTATGARDLYRFPERTAVINPFFNGRTREVSDTDIRSDELDQTIYRTLRFRDLPLVNTAWDIVLNLRNEQVNLDIDAAQLKDVRLYVYYSDFTNL